MAPAGGRRLHPDGRPASGVLQPAALLRPGPAGRVGQVAGGGAASSTTFRVATWNIRAAIGPGEPFPPAWWRHVRQDRFERIARTIEALDADVIGLQEVAVMTPHGGLTDQPAELARLTGRHVRYAAVHAYPLVEPETGATIGAATWGNAILSRTPLTDGFALGLPAGADEDLVEPAGEGRPLAGVPFREAPHGTREPRCALGARLAGAGAPAWVVTTHLAYAGAEQRRAQAGALLDLATRLDGPVIALGDLNAAIESPELTDLRGAFSDAFEAVGVPAGDPARRSCGPNPIDHVLVRGLTVEDCHVVQEAGDASDHLPVVATLAVA